MIDNTKVELNIIAILQHKDVVSETTLVEVIVYRDKSVHKDSCLYIDTKVVRYFWVVIHCDVKEPLLGIID